MKTSFFFCFFFFQLNHSVKWEGAVDSNLTANLCFAVSGRRMTPMHKTPTLWGGPGPRTHALCPENSLTLLRNVLATMFRYKIIRERGSILYLGMATEISKKSDFIHLSSFSYKTLDQHSLQTKAVIELLHTQNNIAFAMVAPSLVPRPSVTEGLGRD